MWKAHDANLDRIVAVKMLLRSSLGDAGARERFRREALVLSRLSHPGVATVFDFDAQDGYDYLVMEYVPGGSLESHLAAGLLPLDGMLHLGAAIADALDNAHRNGVLHRDLKPGNVHARRRRPAGRFVTDFAAWRALAVPPRGPSRTRGSSSARSPTWRPEQLVGRAGRRAHRRLRPRHPCCSRWLTGRLPFVKDRPEALMFAIINSAAPTVRSLRPDAPAVLHEGGEGIDAAADRFSRFFLGRYQRVVQAFDLLALGLVHAVQGEMWR